MSNNNKQILAKPSGITLEQHTSNVMSEAKLLEEHEPFLFEKYQNRIGKSLSKRLEIVCKHHDDGKAIEKWQSACQKDFQHFSDWQLNKKGTYKEYVRAVGQKSGENIRLAAIRHELKSLQLNSGTSMPISLQAAIAAHHSKLSHKHEARWINEGASDAWNLLKKTSCSISETDSFETALQTQYEYAGIRGLLQFTDHRASAKEENDFVTDFKKFQYKFPHNSKRGVQKLIELHWQDQLLLMRAPTGAGKTDASLLWAQLQIENKRADRLIIAMPTRFTSNALAINVAESLSDTGLYHSSAWFTQFQENVDKNEISKKEADKIHEFARLLHTPITVCTIDHLLMALTLTREDHHQITFNMANSCLVIDESDFYDDYTQANILVLLEALKVWNVPVLLMSASLPESAINDYRKLGFDIKNIVEDTSDNNRDRFKIESIISYQELDELENLFQKCIEKESAIIYANTVDKAMLIYDYFKSCNVNAIVYHSRFTEPDKNKKEELLIKCLGREAWENKHAKGIAILTQIGEMSINISADIMISELCPIDRLTQRAGRLCRFDKSKIGEMHVVIPMKNDAVYPAPYGEYDRKNKCWIPLDALTKTQSVLKTKTYNAMELVNILNDIYSEDQEYSSKSIRNAKTLKEYFISNWLIRPMQETSTDDSDTNFWKSRNIAAQDTVFVKQPESSFFNSYMDYQAWKIKNSLELPLYLINKYIKASIIDLKGIIVKDEKVFIHIVKEGFYNIEKGIELPSIDPFI